MVRWIPVDLSSTNLKQEQKVQLQSLLSEYRDIFALTPEELGRIGLVKHRIDTGDHPLRRQRQYRVEEHQRGIIEEHITDISGTEKCPKIAFLFPKLCCFH